MGYPCLNPLEGEKKGVQLTLTMIEMLEVVILFMSRYDEMFR